MKKHESKKRITEKYRKMVIGSILIFIVGLIIIFMAYPKGEVSKRSLYMYEVSREAKYKVYLKDNNYYESKYLNEGMTYISDLVTNIDVDYRYEYVINKKANFKYTYSLSDEIVIESDALNTKNGKLYSKEHSLIKPTSIEKNNANSFEIKQNFSINYAQYNAEVKRFAESYDIPIKAKMYLRLKVYATSEVTGLTELVQEKSVIELNMDLIQDTFKVNKNFEAKDKKDKLKIDSIGNRIDKKYMLWGISISFIAAIGIAISLNRLSGHKEENYYRIKVDKLLTKYEDIVARVVNPIEMENKQIIDVKDFQQLVEIENEIRVPILFYETKPDKEGEFVILTENAVYRFIVGGDITNEEKQ